MCWCQIWELIERVNALPVAIAEEPAGLSSTYIQLDEFLECVLEAWMRWSDTHFSAHSVLMDTGISLFGGLVQPQASVRSAAPKSHITRGKTAQPGLGQPTLGEVA